MKPTMLRLTRPAPAVPAPQICAEICHHRPDILHKKLHKTITDDYYNLKGNYTDWSNPI